MFPDEAEPVRDKNQEREEHSMDNKEVCTVGLNKTGVYLKSMYNSDVQT